MGIVVGDSDITDSRVHATVVMHHCAWHLCCLHVHGVQVNHISMVMIHHTYQNNVT